MSSHPYPKQKLNEMKKKKKKTIKTSKQKTKKILVKRFRITKKGKVLRRQGFRRHLNVKKSSKKKRRLKRSIEVKKSHAKKIIKRF